jgi:hypothetical protein
MTYLGAKNNTKTVMENTMHYNKKTAKNFKSLNKTMKSYNDSNLVLDIANALWIEKDFKLKFCFKKKNKKYFKSAVYPKTTADKINKWASDNTNDKIKEIVDDNDVKGSKLILTNAVYFNAEWKYPFITKSTKKDKFLTADKKEVTVKMMYHKETGAPKIIDFIGELPPNYTLKPRPDDEHVWVEDMNNWILDEKIVYERFKQTSYKQVLNRIYDNIDYKEYVLLMNKEIQHQILIFLAARTATSKDKMILFDINYEPVVLSIKELKELLKRVSKRSEIAFIEYYKNLKEFNERKKHTLAAVQ